MIVLDAVSVVMIARAARDTASGLAEASGPASATLAMLPDAVAAAVQRIRDTGRVDLARVQRILTGYAGELDEIAEGVLSLDQHEHELEHQLRWWGERETELQALLTGLPADDVEASRELALFRGRISGAHAMLRHYTQQRRALADRHDEADAGCAAGLDADSREGAPRGGE